MGFGNSAGGTEVYKYFAAIQFGVCQGPVDQVTNIFVGERKLTPTYVTTVAGRPSLERWAVYGDDNYKLFGGLKREGGCQGYIDIGLGDTDQIPEPYIEDVEGVGKVSAYRGLLSMLFRGSSEAGYTPPPFYPTAVLESPQSEVWIVDLNNGGYMSVSTPTPEYLVTNTTGQPLAIKFPDGGAAFYRVWDPAANSGDGAWDYLPLLADPDSGFYGQVDYVNPEVMAQYLNTEGNAISTDKSFYWSANNPYFKPVWVTVKRILQGWCDNTGNTDPWYPERAFIIQNDVHPDCKYTMNPAHIVYQCITDANFGMGYSQSDIDLVNFTEVADKLFDENFGLSFVWQSDTAIEDFLKSVMSHINGILCVDNLSGKYKIKLLRGGYDYDDLYVFDEDNIGKITSFQRDALGETPNELTLTYYDHLSEPQAITLQNQGAINSQGELISATRDYPGIISPSLAARVADRDLDLISTKLAKIVFTCNRQYGFVEAGDVISISWQELGFESVAFRILNINLGSLESSEITITAVEDIFGLSSATYLLPSAIVPPDPINPGVSKLKLEDIHIDEMTYWDYMRVFGSGTRATHPTLACFPKVFSPKPRPTSYAMRLFREDTPNNYVDVSHIIQHCAMGSLKTALAFTDQVMYLHFGLFEQYGQGFYDQYGLANVPRTDIYAHVGDELIGMTSLAFDYDNERVIVQVKRGVLDTVPKEHAINTPVYVANLSGSAGFDQNPSALYDEVNYRLMDLTGYESYSDILFYADDLPITFGNRIDRPYMVGCIKVNGQINPTSTSATGDIVFSWRNRNKLTIVNELISYLDDIEIAVGSSDDSSYTVELSIFSGSSINSGYLRTFQGSGDITTSFTYTQSQRTADGNPTTITILVNTYKFTNADPEMGDNRSWQTYVHTFELV